MKPMSLRLRTALMAAALPAAFLFAGQANADVKLPAVIGNSMVLQQGQPVPVWGWADDGEKVTVKFGDQTVTTEAAGGKWSVKLAPLTASAKPAEMTVSGKNSITLKDILVGEVWVCSGQSNMEWTVSSAKDAQKEIAAANHPTIRLFDVPNTTSPKEKQTDTKAAWTACTPQTIGPFTAVGYYFGRELNQKLNVPVGLLHSSWGGTPAEAWTEISYFQKSPELAGIPSSWDQQAQNYQKQKEAWDKNKDKLMADWKAKADEAKAAKKPVPQQPRPPQDPATSPHSPATLYNGMISPLLPYASKGAIWYQGESNAGRAYAYRTLLPLMIQSWRDAWGNQDFKFLIVQLANFQQPAKVPGDDSWAELREAQTMTAALPNNGQALAIDLADADNPNDIHPKNKQDVGKRLALVALGKYYGKDVVYAGPEYDSMKIDGEKAVIKFKNAQGLKAKGDKVLGFAICGEDKKWVWADAKVEGDTVVVSSPEVKKPVAVRYAWSINPLTNLYNAADLPANPFRTDNWPGVTQPKK
ncbi:sialate O-acetylesterase [Humisphaera borealis]|uniref:Sialate O-acetylesterase n=1 Tax=Humisphaera borealis TaxID=2807512 RepID=A0A7M2WS92_9BACT|nr:sialate O-acetylesterase [Humisphaera borealis]QOV87661.1 sialate O-acetylesterase [Humisphaera borealis]